jgi:integrase
MTLTRRIRVDDLREFHGVVYKVTMAALLDALVTDYTINKRRSTKDLGYRLAPLREAFGDRRALDVTAARVSEYVSDRLAAGMANASVNRELAALKRAFRLGVEQERLASAPTVKLLREAAPRQGFLKVGDFEALVRHLPDHLRDYARFCYSTGTRKAEAAALAWSDVDREAGRITFRREHTKTGEPRVIPLVGELHAIVERRWAARTLGMRISPLVFHRAGQPIRTFRKAWQRACLAAGHAGLLFHDLRRSAVRNLVGAGVDQAVAMRISGHKTASVFQRYRIVDDADVRAALERTEAAGKRAAASNVVVLNRAAR